MAKSTQKLTPPAAAPKHTQAQNAHLILEYAHEAVTALLAAFDSSRKGRRATGGQTTDPEQDLLRAMVVFAGAGLDAAAKRLIQESLPVLAKQDEAVGEALRGFAARRLREEARAADTARGFLLLAAAISNESPQSAVVAAYVEELIGGSLQSVDRLFEGLSALGLKKNVSVNAADLKNVFETRNRIVHEMDMDLTKANRRRTSRKRDPMIAAVNALLSLGWNLVSAVDQRLP